MNSFGKSIKTFHSPLLHQATCVVTFNDASLLPLDSCSITAGETCSYPTNPLEGNASELGFTYFDETEAQLQLLGPIPSFGDLTATDSFLVGCNFEPPPVDQGTAVAAEQDMEGYHVFGAFDSCSSLGALNRYTEPLGTGIFNLQSNFPIQPNSRQLEPTMAAPLPMLPTDCPVSPFAHYTGSQSFQGWSLQREAVREPTSESNKGLTAFQSRSSRVSEMDTFGSSAAAAQWGIPGSINDVEPTWHAATMASGSFLEATKLPTHGCAEPDAPVTPGGRRPATRQQVAQQSKGMVPDPMVPDPLEQDPLRRLSLGSGASGGTTNRRLSTDSDWHPFKKVGRPIEYKGDINAPSLTEGERRRLKRRKANRESAARVRVKRQDQVEMLELQIAEMEEQNKRLAGAAAAVAIEQAALDEQLAVLHGVLSAFTIENAALRNALLQLHNYVQARLIEIRSMQARQGGTILSESPIIGAPPFSAKEEDFSIHTGRKAKGRLTGLPKGFIMT